MPVETLISVTCEGPRCSRGANESRFQISWNPEAAKQDPNAVPDAAWKLLTILYFTGEQHVFCSVRCQHDWQLDNKELPASPRELQALQQIAAANQQVEIAKEMKRGKVVQMPSVAVEPLTPPDEESGSSEPATS